MFRLLQRIFKKKVAILSDIREDFFHTNFAKAKNRLWQEVQQKNYSLTFKNSELNFSLSEGNLLAWQEESTLEAKDFWLEAFFETDSSLLTEHPSDNTDNVEKSTLLKNESGDTADESAGTYAFGFMFRYASESNYYLVLVSDKGFVRMDVVFNGTPTALLGWTKPTATNQEELFPEKKHNSFHLGILARDTRFSIVLNDSWVADIDDDTLLASGFFAISSQNWTTQAPLTSKLTAFSVDTRLLRLEERNEAISAKITAQDRIKLAARFMSVNRTLPALLQIKKAQQKSTPTIEEFLQIAEIYCAAKLFSEAIKTLEPLTKEKLDTTHKIKVLELYTGALYLNSQTEKALQILKAEEETVKDSSTLLVLRGNAFFEKQEWQNASPDYEKALAFTPESSLLLANRAKSLEKAWLATLKTKPELKTQTIQAYQKAATQLLNMEEYEDLEFVVEKLLELDSKNLATLAIAGKYFYAIEETKKAKDYFSALIKAQTDDSAVWYLMGLILREENIPENLAYFEKASKLAPEYAVYHFRLGEAYLNTLDTQPQNLAIAKEEAFKAIQLDKTYGWAWNLLGSIELLQGNLKEAEELLQKATTILPEEISILENIAEVYRQTNRLQEILQEITPTNQSACLAAKLNPGNAWNLVGNLLAKENHTEEALKAYEKALEISPNNTTFLTNKASACLQIDDINQADILLSKVYELKHSAEVFDLIAYVASRLGDYSRAIVSLRQGIEEFPQSLDLRFNLIELYLVILKYNQAEEVLTSLKKNIHDQNLDNDETLNARVKKLERKIKAQTHRFVKCATCTQEWAIPLDLPWQSSLRLMAEPPGDLPAGKCPTCAKAFCIACAKSNMDESGRFLCPTCKTHLKLADNGFTWLLKQWLETQKA